MKSVIILTQYYPPETGAPQNRLHSLAKYLHAQGFQVRVVTALPNYPRNEIYPGYKGRMALSEVIDNIPVRRSWIYVSSSRGVIARLCNYFSFVVTSFVSVMRQPRATYLMCESPPLFLGITAVLVSAIRGMKLIFNVSDLWPESAEKLGIVTNRFLLGISYRLEHWIYRNAFLISGQTRGIVESISRRFPNKRVVWLPNGVDFAFFDAPPAAIDWRERLGIGTNEFVILYAGIIGHAQGLDVILEAAVMLEGTHARFVLVGDGPEKERLVERAKELNLSSVVFHGNVGKAEIPSLITMCDAYVVPLKKLDLFKGAIPSKLFEPLAMGKPILLGVDGEARVLFIDEGKGGLFFEPESGAGLAAQVQVLMSSPEVAMQLGVSGRQYVRLAFDREKIHQRFLQQVESETKTDA